MAGSWPPRDNVAEEHAGLSAFALDDGVVYHTYSCYNRGLEAFNATYQLLDRAPRGRNEGGLPRPAAWLRRRDEYDAASAPSSVQERAQARLTRNGL